MTRLMAFVVALAGAGAACGRGVSEDPLATGTGATGALAPRGSGAAGFGGSSTASGGTDDGPDVTGGTSGSASGAGSAANGGLSGGGGSSEPGRPRPDGAECRNDSECRSGECSDDVGGTRRCCEDDCDALGGHCDTEGRCACRSDRIQLRNGQPCLLLDGEECGADAECASGNCVDGVCCDAACDGVCEHCNELGSCVASATDPACPAPKECTDRNRCRLPDGQTCSDGTDCESEHCATAGGGATICCESACDGECQLCGPDGTCSGFPARDERCNGTCEPSTRCVTYLPPGEHACSAHGECASCVRIDAQKGVPCGVGRQCDGEGVCEVTGRGRVAAGEQHTCAIDDDANVVCWGDNRFGQLGTFFGRPHVGLDEQPFLLPALTLDFEDDVVQVAASAQHTCVLFDGGAVRCWGTMYNHPKIGVLASIWGTPHYVYATDTRGLPPGSERFADPKPGFIDPLFTGDVILPEPAEQLSAAADGGTVCAVLSSGKVSCWGLNNVGQLGLNHKAQLSFVGMTSLPVVDLGERAVEVRCGFFNTCALTESGRVFCWGAGRYGRLGHGSEEDRLTPVLVDIGEPASGLSVGLDHTCVLLSRGAVRCFGNNFQGELGYGHTEVIGDDETPAEAATRPGPTGRPYLGGDLDLGAKIVEVMTFPARSVPRAVDLDGDGVGDGEVWDSSSTCALSENGHVRCWGRNEFGQLGYGHAEPGAMEHTPRELGDIRESDRSVNVGGEVLALASGGRCALRRGSSADEPMGALYCWGQNDRGQLGVPGNPSPSLTLTPRAIGPVHWQRP
ncbi:MAG TPA: hypothetical protein VFZ53_07185 [Polyangiaceae bacterium]